MSSKLQILFEDNHVIAIVKPPGVLSQEDDTGAPDVLTIVKEDIKERYQKPGNVYLGLVHRLDRPVGGVMILAKTSKAASRLSESVRIRSFNKTYICVVQGTPAPASVQLVHYLRKDARRNQAEVFDQPKAGAKEAILEYKWIASSGNLSLLSVKLHTGRHHQIRAQMARAGHPLTGDLKYGGKAFGSQRSPALWAASASIPHPVSKEELVFHALPEDGDIWQIWSSEQLETAARYWDGQ